MPIEPECLGWPKLRNGRNGQFAPALAGQLAVQLPANQESLLRPAAYPGATQRCARLVAGPDELVARATAARRGSGCLICARPDPVS